MCQQKCQFHKIPRVFLEGLRHSLDRATVRNEPRRPHRAHGAHAHSRTRALPLRTPRASQQLCGR